MRFEWDPAKAEANLRKHGVSFALAQQLFADHRPEWVDTSIDQEVRRLALGRAGEFVFALVYTEPEPDLIRVISLRRATRNEQRLYWQSYPR